MKIIQTHYKQQLNGQILQYFDYELMENSLYAMYRKLGKKEQFTISAET